MKKIIFFVFGLLIIIGCSDINNTPKMKVEEFLNKYNKLDNEVLIDLDTKIYEADIEDEHVEITKEVFKRQYKDMKYRIKNEDIIGNKAIVEVEINVYNYASSKQDAEKYIDEHSEEFITDNIIDEEKTKKYILEKQKETTERKQEIIIMKLHKDNNEWKVEELDEETIEKIHGTYMGY